MALIRQLDIERTTLFENESKSMTNREEDTGEFSFWVVLPGVITRWGHYGIINSCVFQNHVLVFQFFWDIPGKIRLFEVIFIIIPHPEIIEPWLSFEHPNFSTGAEIMTSCKIFSNCPLHTKSKSTGV